MKDGIDLLLTYRGAVTQINAHAIVATFSFRCSVDLTRGLISLTVIIGLPKRYASRGRAIYDENMMDK